MEAQMLRQASVTGKMEEAKGSSNATRDSKTMNMALQGEWADNSDITGRQNLDNGGHVSSQLGIELAALTVIAAGRSPGSLSGASDRLDTPGFRRLGFPTLMRPCPVKPKRSSNEPPPADGLLFTGGLGADAGFGGGLTFAGLGCGGTGAGFCFGVACSGTELATAA